MQVSMMAACMVLRAALLSAIFASISCTDSVPVVVWHSQSLGNDLPSVSAVDRLSRKQFEEDIYSYLKNDGPVLYFLQDSLSLEDFTKYGNVYGTGHGKNSFKNIQSLLEKEPSMMFPSVELPSAKSPKSSISALSHGRNQIDLEKGHTDLKNINNSFVVMYLPSTSTAANRQEALARNDKIIGEAIAQVTTESPSYTAIFTAQRPYWTEGEKEGVRTRRHTLADDTGNYTLVMRNGTTNETCFMFYADYVYLVINGSENDNITLQMPDLSIDDDSDECGNSSEVIKVVVAGSSAVFSGMVKLIFEFGRISYDNDWIINSINVTSPKGDFVVWLPPNKVWAPSQFCFHCTPMNFTLQPVDSPKQTVGYLYLPNFQIQAFEFADQPDAPFGDFFDCVGFFTIAIWMTIFFCGILVIILGFGINAIMSINTMDRFDDPKGKTISVNATD